MPSGWVLHERKTLMGKPSTYHPSPSIHPPILQLSFCPASAPSSILSFTPSFQSSNHPAILTLLPTTHLIPATITSFWPARLLAPGPRDLEKSTSLRTTRRGNDYLEEWGLGQSEIFFRLCLLNPSLNFWLPKGLTASPPSLSGQEGPDGLVLAGYIPGRISAVTPHTRHGFLLLITLWKALIRWKKITEVWIHSPLLIKLRRRGHRTQTGTIDLRLVWLKTSIWNMIFIWKLDLNVADSNLKKKSIKKRGDESMVRKMQTLMSSRPCGTLLNILNI